MQTFPPNSYAPIPSILDLPLPSEVNSLFQRNGKDATLTLNIVDSSGTLSSSDFEGPGSPCTASPNPNQSSVKENDSNHQTFDRTKGNWSAQEDEELKNAIALVKGNISWEDISKKVPGRNPKQCRERWLYRLCPGVNKTPFQKWEDELIVLERQKIGNRWTAISAKLPGRTSYAVKNRWYTVLRNRVSQSLAPKVTNQSSYIVQPPAFQQNYTVYYPPNAFVYV